MVLEYVDGPLIGWLVDRICDRLNWLTDYDFTDVTAAKLTEKAKSELVATLDAPMAEVLNIIENNATLNDRLDALTDEYGIDIAPVKPAPVTDDFNRAIQFTLKYEGGANFTVVNGKPVLKASAKADKGGPTIYGITWTTLKGMCANGVVSHNDITKLTKKEAQDIYRVSYWDKYGWEKLPYAVAICCLDCCVNHGGFAWILQRALTDRGHKVTIDGKFGPETYNALLSASVTETSALALANAIIERRREYFRNIVEKNPTQKGFLKGWLNRCDALAVACKEV